jgi:tetratricopeptide (TPR) repeat protein
MVLALAGALALSGCDLFTDEAPQTSTRGMPKRRPEFKLRRPSDVPLPKGVPFAGETGDDTFGRPLRRPDAPALLALLRAEEFEALEAAFAEYQHAFEADPRKESWPLLAADAFGIPDPELGPHLEAWVTGHPASASALTCRGKWHLAMAWHERGAGTAAETSNKQFATFRGRSESALADFDRALSFNEKAIAVHRAKIDALRGLGASDDDQRKAFERGLAVCKTCTAVRAAWVFSQAPRWGGSKAAMLDASKVSPEQRKTNPALALLPSYAEFDACRTARLAEGPKGSLEACERAVSRGVVPRITCYYAHQLVLNQDYAAAEPHLEAGLRANPQERTCLVGRAWAHKHFERFEASAEDVLLARRLDPTNPNIDGLTTYTLERLRYDAREAGKAGDDAKDRRLRALANAISPGAGDPRPTQGLSPANLEILREEVASKPRDFALHVKLDQALVREQRFSEIVTMWDGFLETQPDHAQALLERAGARWHSGDHNGGRDDAQRACDLGLKKACSVRTQMSRAK